MKKSLNISHLCNKTIFPTWAYGGTVDTPVLGTGHASGESSNLSKPTNKMSALVKLADKIRSCVACCGME